MYINKITLDNFGSYFGKQEFDFKTSTGFHGYAIFGEIGRGKTTLVDSVLWALYGSVEVTKETGGRILKKDRPLVDAQQMEGEYQRKWYLPLLNFDAWYDKNYNFSVQIEFEHHGRNYHLLRDVTGPKKIKPQTDRDVTHEVHLSVDGKTVPAAMIPSVIEEIIPKRISKFFFVEVDSIRAYSSLLDQDGSADGSIVDDVEAILGMPALERSKDDFLKLSDKKSKELERLLAAASGAASIKKKIDELDNEIDQYDDDMKAAISRMNEINDRIAEIDLEMSGHTDAETLMESLKAHQAKKKKLEEEKADFYENRTATVSNNSWKYLIQSKLEMVSTRLDDKITQYDELVLEKSKRVIQRDHLKNEVTNDGAECVACGHLSSNLTKEEKKKKMDQMFILDDEIEDYQKKIGKLGDPKGDAAALSRYRDSSSYDSVDTLEKQISVHTFDISEEKKKIDALTIALANHDVLAIQTWQNEKSKLIEERGQCKLLKESSFDQIDVRKRSRGELSDKLKIKTQGVSSPKKKELELLGKTYTWLTNTFENELASFKDEAKKSVEKLASEAWDKLIPEPERYKGIQINESWNTQVIGTSGRALPISNPGHRQTLAVCLFDGLRKTSRRRFPTFFDNPGSNIGEYTLVKMAEHFWEDATDQIVMLSHGGGLKKDETIDRYGAKLAKAWELSYVSGNDKTITEVNEVKL